MRALTTVALPNTLSTPFPWIPPSIAMTPKTKLELTWIGKENRPRLEPRILLEDPCLSYSAGTRVGENDIFDNVLIQGGNLLALKALEQSFSGKVRFIYIDPPFNTGQAFEHYDDGIEHSLWLDLMARRVEILAKLLATNGVIFVHLDQEEVHYLKIVMDEVFGRQNYLGQIAYERSGVSGLGQGGAFVVNTHEYILCYCRARASFKAEDLSGSGELEAKDMKRYSRVLVSPGARREVARFVAPSTNQPVVIYKHSDEVIETISLRNFEDRYDEILARYIDHFAGVFRLTSVQKENEFQNRILAQCKGGLYSADYLVARGRREGEVATTYYHNEQIVVWLADTAEVRDGRIMRTGKLSDFWAHGDIPKADLANEGGVDFRRGKKPETLLRRLLRMTTKPGDLVLDSFGGSGTTGAVAHKMGRRWIMVELGEQAHTHIVPRLKRVVDGSDQSGISKEAAWKGGGGFRFYRLAPSLLARDKWGNYVISESYRKGPDAGARLAEAMCKLEGFSYAPSAATFWIHGHSTERDYIYVTTQTLTHEQLAAISEEVGPDRSLLICCGAFLGRPEQLPNLTLKKIPATVLARCEYPTAEVFVSR